MSNSMKEMRGLALWISRARVFWEDRTASAKLGSRSLFLGLRTARRPEYLDKVSRRVRNMK